MARFEINSADLAAMGHDDASGDIFFRLGMMCSIGREAEPDLVSAHKWFNLAAMKGKREAVQYRQEVAGELSAAEIADAQRSAREWLRTH
ncbi:hypothetical protein GGD81_003059 [Rhodobium orientis]|nr:MULTISPECIES: hypothetical protein [Rhodobium]MBB4304004.1 hypothetical protein [Rhodobium orientis]MCW2309434.1 TPR repeat protein [Rhodobium gokarnense]